jgi:hypothetical protein
MSSSTNNCWIDTSVLPSDILSLQGYDFFKVVERLTSETVVDLIRIQAIRNVRVFMLVPDITAVLKIDSVELDLIKSQVCFRLKNNNYIVKAGIEASLRYLRELFAKKINEYYQQEQHIDTDTSVSSDDNVPVGQKRANSSEQISNKRGRK